MFVEEKRSGEAQVEPSWEDFLDWLAGKDPHEYYKWSNPWGCAGGQYFEDRGRPLMSRHTHLYLEISRAAAYPWPRTFGKLQEHLNVKSRSGRTDVRPHALSHLRSLLASVFG